MGPKYQVGQKVVVRWSKGAAPSARDSDIRQYDGQIGTVTSYYSISLRAGQVFYIYTVRIGTGEKEIVLHEDEMKTGKAKVR